MVSVKQLAFGVSNPRHGQQGQHKKGCDGCNCTRQFWQLIQDSAQKRNFENRTILDWVSGKYFRSSFT